MASKADDAKKLLDLFHAAYHATQALHAGVVELSKEAIGKDQQNKARTMAAFLGELKQMHAGFNELHHSIGHLMYGECWHNTEVGQEFVNPIQALLDKLGVNMSAEVINLDEPLPDHLEPEVKDALNKFKLSQQMSRKAHLH